MESVTGQDIIELMGKMIKNMPEKYLATICPHCSESFTNPHNRYCNKCSNALYNYDVKTWIARTNVPVLKQIK